MSQTGDIAYPEDRYERLKACTATFVEGTDFGDGFLTGEMCVALAATLTQARVLDGLSEHDANTVSMLTVLDFSCGIARMAWRLTDWLSENRTVRRDDDDEFAVVAVLARILAITTAAFVGEGFEIAQQHWGGPTGAGAAQQALEEVDEATA